MIAVLQFASEYFDISSLSKPYEEDFSAMHDINTPLVLVILDGLGHSTSYLGNAPLQAGMHNFDSLCSLYPSCLLHASGKHVGLLPEKAGNSQAGHLTIGAGRIIPSDIVRMNNFFEHESTEKKILIDHVQGLIKTNGTLHLIGLVSDGGVHSHQSHLHSLIKLVYDTGMRKIFIHAFLDGRDTPPYSAMHYLNLLEEYCLSLNVGKLASIIGRFYAMDRDHNWDRTVKAYNSLTQNGPSSHDWQTALKQYYAEQISDEFIPPTQLLHNTRIQSGDGVIFFNVRPDRARQLTSLFIYPEMTKTYAAFPLHLSFFIGGSLYSKDFLSQKFEALLPPLTIYPTLIDLISSTYPEKKIVEIAETEKYAHVTYFFKGMREELLPQESRILIASIKAKTYASLPHMSAAQVTQAALETIEKTSAIFSIINYANADMVGHSGNLSATIEACKHLDDQLKMLFDVIVKQKNGTLIITADHGNAEEMINPETRMVTTSHTHNPVRCVIINDNMKRTSPICINNAQLLGGLARITPTILKLLNIPIPEIMEQPLPFE